MGWRFYYTRQVDEARINQSTDHSLSGDILFGLGGNLDMASRKTRERDTTEQDQGRKLEN